MRNPNAGGRKVLVAAASELNDGLGRAGLSPMKARGATGFESLGAERISWIAAVEKGRGVEREGPMSVERGRNAGAYSK